MTTQEDGNGDADLPGQAVNHVNSVDAREAYYETLREMGASDSLLQAAQASIDDAKNAPVHVTTDS